jgi:hypothetical protein
MQYKEERKSTISPLVLHATLSKIWVILRQYKTRDYGTILSRNSERQLVKDIGLNEPISLSGLFGFIIIIILESCHSAGILFLINDWLKISSFMFVGELIILLYVIPSFPGALFFFNF